MTLLAEAIAEIKGAKPVIPTDDGLVDVDTGEIVEVAPDDGYDLMEIGPGVTADATGLVFERNLSVDEWLEAGNRVFDVCLSSNWWLGDMLVHGEDFHGEAIASQLYDTFNEEVIRAAITTCRAIPKHQRRADVPYSHHRLVTKYSPDERAEILETIATNRFTLDQARAYLKAREGGQVEEPEPKVKADPTAVLALCEAKEGKQWTRDDTNAVRFYLGG